MRSHRALLIGVLIPAAFSHALYSGLTHRGGFRRSGHYERSFGPVGFRPPSSPPPFARFAPLPPPPLVQRCDFRDVRSLSAPADAADRLDVSAGSGDLRMDAVQGLDRVEVEATLCASSPEELERLQLSLTRDGDLLRVATGGTSPDRGPERGDYGRVDLRISVPFGLRATWRGDDLPGFRPPAAPRPFERPMNGRMDRRGGRRDF